MASIPNANVSPVKIIFTDIPAGVAVDSTFELNASFHDFTSLLSQLSGSVFDQIKGLHRHRLSAKGFILRDGCWWYRIVKISSSEGEEADLSLTQPTKGEWKKLTTLVSYKYMCENELASGLASNEGWIEVQHVSPNTLSPRVEKVTELGLVGSSEEARRSPCCPSSRE